MHWLSKIYTDFFVLLENQVFIIDFGMIFGNYVQVGEEKHISFDNN